MGEHPLQNKEKNTSSKVWFPQQKGTISLNSESWAWDPLGTLGFLTSLCGTLTPWAQKNAHGKIIILYDDDERLASQAATTMCERGFENLFMLSGGEPPTLPPQTPHHFLPSTPEPYL